MKVNIIIIVGILTLLTSVFRVQGQQILCSLHPTIRDAEKVEIGFNRRSDNGIWWSDNSFQQLLNDMDVDVLRYPAGTQANYWDWHFGKFIPNAGKNWGNKEVLTIPDFVNAIPQRAQIVYVVNMARPTPSTGISVNASEAILKSTNTLNAKITDMLAALAKFNTEGKLPYAVELGNEFFFGNEEGGVFEIVENNGSFYAGWNPSINSAYVSSSKKQATVVNAKFYLDQCKQVVASIKSVYPNMKFALVTTKSGNGNSNRDMWNNTVFNELNTNPNYATLKASLYAITQHHYINDSYGDQTVIHNYVTSKVAIAEGFSYTQGRQSDYNMVPSNYKIWYTEYGVTKQTAEKTWAGGMRYLSYTLGWIDLGDKVGQLDYHYITDDNVIKTGLPMKLAPIGIASELLMRAKANMDEMQKIAFISNPLSINGIESLHGYKFKNNDKETAIIMNINSVDYSQINIASIFTYNGQAKMTQYYSNVPYISNVYLGHSNIDSSVVNINTSFDANKFSITVIEVEKNLGIHSHSVDNIQFDISPNPVNDRISISCQHDIFSATIWNAQGAKIKYIDNPRNEIELSNLPKGMYIIQIYTKQGSAIKKFIKL